MANKLYGGLSDDAFRSMAKHSVVDWWNAKRSLVNKYGTISTRKVYIVWQVKAIQNSKALLGVSFDGDGMYFEFTWNGDDMEAYLDCYKKTDHKVIAHS